MINFVCPHCNKSHSVNSNLAGRKTKCKGCAQSMQVPQMDDMPMSQPEADDALANMANAIDQPRSASRNSQSPTRSRSRRPTRKPEKQFPLLAVAGVIIFVLLFLLLPPSGNDPNILNLIRDCIPSAIVVLVAITVAYLILPKSKRE